MTYPDLLGGPPPTELPDDSAVRSALDAGADPVDVAASHPAVPAAWAVLAEHALTAGEPVAAYAYARTGYHRGLDALRRAGWKGHGPVPWEHEPNRGFLRCLGTLSRAAAAIGETAEEARCEQLLADSSATAVAVLATTSAAPSSATSSRAAADGAVPGRPAPGTTPDR